MGLSEGGRGVPAKVSEPRQLLHVQVLSKETLVGCALGGGTLNSLG